MNIPNDVTKAQRPICNNAKIKEVYISWSSWLKTSNFIIFKKFVYYALPSRINSGTHDMFGSFDVKGDATEASASDNDIPACALLRAPQSFAPSPHIAT